MKPFANVCEACAWMIENAFGVTSVTIVGFGYLTGSPGQARDVLARIDDPWPTDCVQEIR